MDKACLDHLLTESERLEFQKNGYLILRGVLSEEQIDRLTEAVDRIDAKERKMQGLDQFGKLPVRDFIGKDESFVDLIDYPRTFPKVFGILGWNIQIYHSHLNVTFPEAPDGDKGLGLSWHQDTARVNQEMETSPRPRLSVKLAFFLTDTSEPGRGNFHVIPGSQLKDKREWPEGDRTRLVEGSIPVLAPRGSAVIFDRRLWHTASANHSDGPRKVIFYGYSYRWLRPRDECTVTKFWDRMDPIQKQLFHNAPTGAYGFTSPQEEDVPLRTWMEEHLGKEAVSA